jgi:hypothetical protein
MYVVTPLWNLYVLRFSSLIGPDDRSRWPRGLRRGSAATRLLELQDQIPSANGCLSLLRDVCFGAEFFAAGRSLAQGSHTEYCVSK